MGSSMELVYLTLSGLEKSNSRSLYFEVLYRIKEKSYAMCYYHTLIGNYIRGVQWHQQI